MKKCYIKETLPKRDFSTKTPLYWEQSDSDQDIDFGVSRGAPTKIPKFKPAPEA